MKVLIQRQAQRVPIREKLLARGVDVEEIPQAPPPEGAGE
jgi:hypothetical protein